MLTLVHFVLGSNARASEFDQERQSNSAPQGVLVQVDSKTQNVTVFRADKKVDPSFVSEVARPENIISQVNAIDLSKKSEFDFEKSTQSWFFYYYGNYWAPQTYFSYYSTPYTYYTYNWTYFYTRASYSYYWYWY